VDLHWVGIRLYQVNGTIVWTQPEILLFQIPPCAEVHCGIGYPDFVDLGDRVLISETDKVHSRLHNISSDLLKGLMSQHLTDTVAASPTVSLSPPPEQITAPTWGDLDHGAGFTIEMAFKTPSGAWEMNGEGEVALLDCSDSGHGVRIMQNVTDDAVTINLGDATTSTTTTWTSDDQCRIASRPHNHVSFIVDGSSRFLGIVVNGVLNDGGSERLQGWTKLGAIASVDAKDECSVSPSVTLLRVYQRALRTSEAIGNWRSGVKATI